MFYRDIFSELERDGVRYLVAGGVAVVLHGFVRATADLDLIVDLDPGNLSRFLVLMTRRGYLPRVPVRMEDFADEEKRRSWIEEKGMKVFSVFHPQRHGELIDVFVREPFPFAQAYERRLIVEVGGCSVSVVAREDLMALKRAAGRPQDLEDLRALERPGEEGAS